MKYYNFFIASLIFFIALVSCSKDKESTIIENNLSISVNESIIDEPLDLSIKNILIYPNQFDKKLYLTSCAIDYSQPPEYLGDLRRKVLHITGCKVSGKMFPLELI